MEKNWSSDFPTIGKNDFLYYWCWPEGYQPEVVLITRDFPSDKIVVWEIGSDKPKNIDKNRFYLWAPCN